MEKSYGFVMENVFKDMLGKFFTPQKSSINLKDMLMWEI